MIAGSAEGAVVPGWGALDAAPPMGAPANTRRCPTCLAATCSCAAVWYCGQRPFSRAATRPGQRFWVQFSVPVSAPPSHETGATPADGPAIGGVAGPKTPKRAACVTGRDTQLGCKLGHFGEKSAILNSKWADLVRKGRVSPGVNCGQPLSTVSRSRLWRAI